MITQKEAYEKILEIRLYGGLVGINCTEALDMALDALEQGPVLDKIRAEIENHCSLIKDDHCKYCSSCNSVIGVREILEIIDKYKEEGM